MLCDILCFSRYKHPTRLVVDKKRLLFSISFYFKPQNPKAGEVLYADLGEFHAMQKMREVSTSPKSLPPIKMPEAYAETQYADITQFLK